LVYQAALLFQGLAAMPSWLIARDSRDKSGLLRHTLSGFFCNDYDTTAEVDAGLQPHKSALRVIKKWLRSSSPEASNQPPSPQNASADPVEAEIIFPVVPN
jgi:hypothetical protein